MPDSSRVGKELAAAVQALLTIEGVEGIGQPVTVIDPGELRAEFLAFIERLRGGAIELDEELLVVNLAAIRRRRRWKQEPALERLRQALFVLCRYAQQKGTSAADVIAALDEAKRKLSLLPRRRKEQG